jgi:hypothetical protein
MVQKIFKLSLIVLMFERERLREKYNLNVSYYKKYKLRNRKRIKSKKQ